ALPNQEHPLLFGLDRRGYRDRRATDVPDSGGLRSGAGLLLQPAGIGRPDPDAPSPPPGSARLQPVTRSVLRFELQYRSTRVFTVRYLVVEVTTKGGDGELEKADERAHLYL